MIVNFSNKCKVLDANCRVEFKRNQQNELLKNYCKVQTEDCNCTACQYAKSVKKNIYLPKFTMYLFAKTKLRLVQPCKITMKLLIFTNF